MAEAQRFRQVGSVGQLVGTAMKSIHTLSNEIMPMLPSISEWLKI